MKKIILLITIILSPAMLNAQENKPKVNKNDKIILVIIKFMT